MTACQDTRDLLVDLALGRLDQAEQQRIEQHLSACTSCQQEQAAIRLTVQWLQQAPALKPSASFRALLDRRLDRVDSEAEPVLPTGWSERWSFRWHLVVHRVRSSPQAQIQLAAAFLVVALGLFMALWKRPEVETSGHPVAESFSPPPAPSHPDTPGPAPAGELRRDILEQQVDETPQQDVEELLPVFTDEGAVLVDAGKPSRSGRSQLIDDTDLQRLQPREGEDSPVPVRSRDQAPSGPDVFPDPIQGVDDAIQRSMRWLARQQRPDGSFVPGGGEPGLDVASTASVVLVFLSEGHRGLPAGHPEGDPLRPQDQVVDQAMSWLLDQVGMDGRFGPATDPAVEILNQSLACLAVTEHRLLLGEKALQRFPDEQRILVHGLDHLERRFLQLYQAEDARLRRAAGENAAWSALALVTAHRSGLALGLSPHGQERLAAMMRRLRNEPSESSRVSSHAVMAMMDRSSGAGRQEDVAIQWQRVIAPIVAAPRSAPVSLRFLVASALCPWDLEGGNQSRWNRLQPELERAVLPLQDSRHGYFQGTWGAIPEGVVMQTALATLTLQVPRRTERLREAVRSH